MSPLQRGGPPFLPPVYIPYRLNPVIAVAL